MSFTTQIQPIGGERGLTPVYNTETDPLYVTAVGDLPAGAVGSEGSSDDPQALFPDTFVDLAKASEEKSDEEPPKKKKKQLSEEKKEDEEESRDEVQVEMQDEVL